MAGEGEKEGEKGFKVSDRRRFAADTGEPREEIEKAAPSEVHGQGSTHEAQREIRSAQESLPEINFSTFVISLSTQALMHLGEIPNPLSGKVEGDLPVAKQMIDIVAMLREKTRGNLDQGEEKLMDDVLYDLRMRYVEAAKKR